MRYDSCRSMRSTTRPIQALDPTRIARRHREDFRGLTPSVAWISFGVRQRKNSPEIRPNLRQS